MKKVDIWISSNIGTSQKRLSWPNIFQEVFLLAEGFCYTGIRWGLSFRELGIYQEPIHKYPEI